MRQSDSSFQGARQESGKKVSVGGRTDHRSALISEYVGRDGRRFEHHADPTGIDDVHNNAAYDADQSLTDAAPPACARLVRHGRRPGRPGSHGDYLAVVAACPSRSVRGSSELVQRGTNALRDGAFFQASKALERAVATDDKYVLAHARLAESLVELDFVDRAKDELLRATSLASDRSLLPKADALYVDAISAVVRRDFPAAIESYAAIAKQTSDTEKARVLVDLGRAYEKNDDLKKAVETYTEAANRNPQYATAFLRLGILYGRQRDLANALSSFDKAEAIYQALGNIEGRTEAVYQRGALFNQLNKLLEAQDQLEQHLALARASDNTPRR